MFGKRSQDSTAPRRALTTQEAGAAPVTKSADARPALVEARAPAKPEPVVVESGDTRKSITTSRPPSSTR